MRLRNPALGETAHDQCDRNHEQNEQGDRNGGEQHPTKVGHGIYPHVRIGEEGVVTYGMAVIDGARNAGAVHRVAVEQVLAEVRGQEGDGYGR